MEARLVEMEADAKRANQAKETFEQSPEKQFPCNKCRWVESEWANYPALADCQHPMITGIHGKRVGVRYADLCGPERALWERKPSILASFWRWFFAPWRDA